MKVITAAVMQEIDTRAITERGIPGLQLMERAGCNCVDEIVARFGPLGRCIVFAGKGNNGGDGYVIARLLGEKGWRVAVVVLAGRDCIGGDAAVNLHRLPESVVTFYTREGELAARLQDEILLADVVVDALFGTGLSSPVGGIYREAVTLINGSGRPVVAVDIPSGIHGTTGQVMGEAVKADITVTFACAKLGHVLYPGSDHAGQLVVTDIGIPDDIHASAAGYEFLNEAAIRPLLCRRDRRGHKGTYGHCLVIAGSTGKTGAATLAANSALRSGSGLVTLGGAERIHTVLEIKTTEVMTVPLPDSGRGFLGSEALPAIEKLLEGKDAVAVGPGCGLHPETVALIRRMVESVTLPLIVDADGLNALALDPSLLLQKKSGAVVLTPHPGEMARLAGISVPEVEVDRIAVARNFARTYDVYLVLKGSRTVVASPAGAVAINGSGNPGMATAGMGDVLTGVVVSLLGQGYNTWEACCIGVFLHGYAADLVAGDKGEIGMTATDVYEKLPYAYERLFEIK